ncbi:DUF5675 family protein [Spirosoma litoris]
MELLLKRTDRTEAYTGGILGQVLMENALPFVPICQTLEDPIREFGPHGEGKIKSKTAIPPGRYRVILSLSTRFKKVMPELVNVPFFAGIRIHPGNTVDDTDGCLLVGQQRVKNELIDSRSAYARLMTILEKADAKKEKVFLTIVNS